jgi:hypothetical protein
MNNVTPTRPCTVNGSPAFFHRWVTEDKGLLKVHAMTRPREYQALYDYYIANNIIPSSCSLEKMTETLALVEMLDGSMKKVPAIEIRFTDREGQA